MGTAAQFVARAVRESDPDRYLSALYAPADKRDALLALAAFDGEIAAVRDRTSQPMTGEVRLQWWQDAISAGEGTEGAANPVLAELNRAIVSYALPKEAFDRYLEARVFDLYDDPMPSRGDLEGYAGETASTLTQLSSLVLDPTKASGVADAAGHAGCVQAVVGVLRRVPIHRARGQCYLPLDLLAAAGSSRDEWVSGVASEANERAFAAMIALVHEHLNAFSRQAPSLPPALRPAFLPVALAPAYLAALERAGVARPASVDLSVLRRHWLLFRHATGGWR